MQQHSFPAFSQPAVPTSLPMAGAGAGAGGAWPSALLANTPSTSGVPPPQAHQLAGEGARDAQQLAQLVSILSSAKAANDAAVQHQQQQQAQALMQAQASADLVSVLREIVRSGQTTSVRHLEHVLQGMMIARAKEAATATAMQQLLGLLAPSNQQALGLIDPGNLQQNLGLLLGAAAQGGGDTTTLASPPLAQRMTSAQPQAQPNSKRMRLSDFITPQTSTPMSLSNFSPPPPSNGAASAAAAGAPGVPPPPPPPPVFNRPARIRVGNKSRTKFRTFQEARAFAHSLKLTGQKQWYAWSSSGKRPLDIPSNPDMAYANTGWISYPDFLGYAEGKMARGQSSLQFRDFESARTYVRSLGLKSVKQWNEWSASGKRPYDIPSDISKAYAGVGWMSFPDFLGYAEGKKAREQRSWEYRSFEDARAFVRTLKLKCAKSWYAWSSSGQRPSDVPSRPDTTYANAGWISYPDFLGYAEGKKKRQWGDAVGGYRCLESLPPPPPVSLPLPPPPPLPAPAPAPAPPPQASKLLQGATSASGGFDLMSLLIQVGQQQAQTLKEKEKSQA